MSLTALLSSVSSTTLVTDQVQNRDLNNGSHVVIKAAQFGMMKPVNVKVLYPSPSQPVEDKGVFEAISVCLTVLGALLLLTLFLILISNPDIGISSILLIRNLKLRG